MMGQKMKQARPLRMESVMEHWCGLAGLKPGAPMPKTMVGSMHLLHSAPPSPSLLMPCE